MKCTVVRKHLSDYMDRVLTEDVKERVEKHLHSCDACSKLLASLKALREKLGKLEEVDVPEEFLQKVRE